MRRLVLLAFILSLIAPSLIVTASAPAGPAPQFGRGTLNLHQNGRRVTLAIEIADTTETRSYGLMFRRTLAENTGMLFAFEQEGKWGFWMKNTLISLSIAFIDSRWRILEIQDMAVPDPQAASIPIYEPGAPYRYALEVNQGYFQRRGITAGARLEFIPAK